MTPGDPDRGAAAPSADEQSARLEAAAAAVRERTDIEPEVAIVLGTGLAGLAEEIEAEAAIPYSEIPHLPEPTVETHAGRLLIGTLGGRRVAALQGRVHHYEGYTLRQVAFPVRLLAWLGVEALVISGAGGGMNPLWSPGDLMLLDDQINLMGGSPLIGPNLERLGPRFPDMSEPYDQELQQQARAVALEHSLPLRRGVYAAVTGPNLETRAEYRMLRAAGADVVGMSTVPEVIVARHAGVRVLGITVITDAALPDALEPVDVDEILRIAGEADPKLTRIVAGVLERM